MNSKINLNWLKFALIAFVVPIAMPALGQTPDDLQDLVGARGSSGETQLEARGYKFIRTTTVRGQKWSYWLGELNEQCVQIATDNGRYSTINQVPASNCRQRQNNSNNQDFNNSNPSRNRLTLICYGAGRKPSVSTRTEYEWDDNSNRYQSRSVIGSTTNRFDSEVQVEIRGQKGKIHLTGKLIPPINSGGEDGWWKIEDINVTPNRITGKYVVNFLNSPRIDIDRRSGRIAIDGIEKFNGTCDLGDWGGGRTRF